MNAVEQMQGQVVILGRRVEALEGIVRRLTVASGDAVAAGQCAEKLGFAVDVLVLPARVAERRALANELRRKGWSASRVARALNCAEKTVQRWARSQQEATEGTEE